jgi:putative hydrolase of the HAD superfamily
MNDSIDLVLFDVGGVLCELGNDPVPREWIPGERRFSLDDWFYSELALAFEKGLIEAETLAAAFRKDLGIKQDVSEILEYFDAWLIGPWPGAIDMLQAIPDRYRLAILSNTNALHWPKISEGFGFQAHMERIFSSHLLGLAKPEPEIFRFVAKELTVPAGRILFLDDNADNVRAAKLEGMQSERVNGIRETRQALVDLGVLSE